jgi:hypothetical protein
MRRAIFALLAATALASSSGCCCFEKLFCCGWGGCCGYGHEGPCGGCCDSCGGGGCYDCGMAGNTVTEGGYADGQYGPGGPPNGPPNAAMARAQGKYHPAHGHPLMHPRRNAGGQYEFAAGPPTGGVTYPYYTNRGPRDYLAKNPRGIGP